MALSHMEMALAYRPASIDMRDGTHSGKLQYAFSKTVPRSASRSRWGVLTSACP